ncbi:MAG: hypothetical protein JO132_15120 [Streptosporangiaceae bacterium]|nr:hypothetical protein [Streptosporangiaceae bacterium]
MTHDERPNDSAVTWELRDSLSALTVPGRPSLAAITSRGRARQRRRRAGFAGLGVTGAIAGTAVAVGLTGVLGASSLGGAGTIRTAAFTLTSNANGTDTLTLTAGQVFDPALLQRALAQRGIPALVKTDAWCSSSLAAPNPASIGVLAFSSPVKSSQGGLPALGFREQGRIGAHIVAVINPAKMPSGTGLFFGYYDRDHALSPNLIYTRSYTCVSGEQPPANG